MRRRWTSPRSLLAHLGMVFAVGVCGAAARWQIQRAASGNLLSYAYAVEWPLLAIAAVVMWWQFIHDDRPSPQVDGSAPMTGGRSNPPPSNPPPSAPSVEDPALRSYNDELAALATSGRRKTWRNPRGLP